VAKFIMKLGSGAEPLKAEQLCFSNIQRYAVMHTFLKINFIRFGSGGRPLFR